MNTVSPSAHNPRRTHIHKPNTPQRLTELPSQRIDISRRKRLNLIATPLTRLSIRRRKKAHNEFVWALARIIDFNTMPSISLPSRQTGPRFPNARFDLPSIIYRITVRVRLHLILMTRRPLMPRVAMPHRSRRGLHHPSQRLDQQFAYDPAAAVVAAFHAHGKRFAAAVRMPGLEVLLEADGPLGGRGGAGVGVGGHGAETGEARVELVVEGVGVVAADVLGEGAK